MKYPSSHRFLRLLCMKFDYPFLTSNTEYRITITTPILRGWSHRQYGWFGLPGNDTHPTPGRIFKVDISYFMTARAQNIHTLHPTSLSLSTLSLPFSFYFWGRFLERSRWTEILMFRKSRVGWPAVIFPGTSLIGCTSYDLVTIMSLSPADYCIQACRGEKRKKSRKSLDQVELRHWLVSTS